MSIGIESKLHNILTKQLNSKNIFNAVLAVKSGNGEIDWAGAIGDVNHTEKTKMQVDTPYFIASVTKMYSSAVIMHLHERNLLNLDDSISKYLPASLIVGIHSYKAVDYVGKLKIIHLLSHTSGLADYFIQKQKDGENVLDKIIKYGDYGWDINEVMTIVREELTPRFKPGESNKAYYSDTNYQLLGNIIESVTSKSLSEVYSELIFTPLGLQNTYLFSNTFPENRSQPAEIYYEKHPMSIPKAMSSFGPDGGIISNVQESIIFLKAFLDGTLFPKDYLKEMKQWKRIFSPLQYGYGLMRFKLPRIFSPFRPLPELIGHSGATASFLFYCRDKDLYLAGTLNQIKEQSKPFRLMLEVINSIQ